MARGPTPVLRANQPRHSRSCRRSASMRVTRSYGEACALICHAASTICRRRATCLATWAGGGGPGRRAARAAGRAYTVTKAAIGGAQSRRTRGLYHGSRGAGQRRRLVQRPVCHQRRGHGRCQWMRVSRTRYDERVGDSGRSQVGMVTSMCGRLRGRPVARSLKDVLGELCACVRGSVVCHGNS